MGERSEVRGEPERPEIRPAQFDPICGRRVTGESSNTLQLEYKRRKYFFCSEGCRHAFEQRAEKFRIAELAKAGALLTPGRVRWGLA